MRKYILNFLAYVCRNGMHQIEYISRQTGLLFKNLALQSHKIIFCISVYIEISAVQWNV